MCCWCCARRWGRNAVNNKWNRAAMAKQAIIRIHNLATLNKQNKFKQDRKKKKKIFKDCVFTVV